MKSSRVIAGVSLLIALGCASPFLKPRAGSPAGETGSVMEARTQSAPLKKGQETFLDTLNKASETGLGDSDFAPLSPASTTVLAPSDEASSNSSPDQSAADTPSRFRIQVLAANQIESLRKEKKILETKVDLPFLISFEAPYYKLYAGDFSRREDAEGYLPRFKKMGYNDSWVVRTKALPE